MSTLTWNIQRDFIVTSRSTFLQNVAFCYPYLDLGPSRQSALSHSSTKVTSNSLSTTSTSTLSLNTSAIWLVLSLNILYHHFFHKHYYTNKQLNIITGKRVWPQVLYLLPVIMFNQYMCMYNNVCERCKLYLTTCSFCIICCRSKVFSPLFQVFLKVTRIWHNCL